MYNLQTHDGQGLLSQNSWLKRAHALIAENATSSNLAGLIAAIFALFCLLALPQPWNIRLPLYLLVTVWTILRPRVALYLLPIAIPWGSLDTISLGGMNMNSADILVFLLTASWLISFVLRPMTGYRAIYTGPLDRENFNLPRYLAVAMLVLLFTMLLSMTNTFSLSSSLKEISKWLEVLAILFLGTQYLRTRRQIWTLVVIICLAAISQACLGYIQAFFNLGPQSFIRDSGLRVYGTFDQPNPYAGYINISLCIAVALALLGRSWAIRILAGLTAILLAVALDLSQSRGGFIAIAVALLFIVVIGIPQIRTLVWAGALGALGIVGAYMAGLLPESVLKPILKILGLTSISLSSPTPDDFSTAERLAHWIVGINMFQDHPLTGVGIGNYPNVYPQYAITIFVNPLGHAHNYYINIAAEAGFFGLAALLLFLATVFVAGGHSLRVISKKSLPPQRVKLPTGVPGEEPQKTFAHFNLFANDRALAIGLLASLLSVCVHNLVDNLYVHSMTSLFALLIILLIRLEGVTPNIRSTGGHFD